jgi:hypothetical protein
MRVRFRIDGSLHEMMAPPYKFKAAIVSRLEIMADLDIAERRVPQDGRIKIKVLNRTIDLRVNALPTIFGEKIVMRILDKANLNIDLEKLGFEPQAMKEFLGAILNPYGMVLVTGPTGSGKTTTLYSALSRVNQPDVNVLTAEDPVEYNLEGINQVLVNDSVGLSFAAALRRSCARTPTSSWSARSATSIPRRSPPRPRSRATSCSRRCTPTTRRAPSGDWWTWASNRSWSASSVNLDPRAASRAQGVCALPSAGRR